MLYDLVQGQRYSAEALADVLSFFQPRFEEYAREKGIGQLTLFRAGTWLVDMWLAAAGDTGSLRQWDKAQYFMQEMRRLEAPPGALDALTRINAIVAKSEITDVDVRDLLRLTQRLQHMLLDYLGSVSMRMFVRHTILGLTMASIVLACTLATAAVGSKDKERIAYWQETAFV